MSSTLYCAALQDRYWRKNRRPNDVDPHSGCEGVDLNRNFDVAWGSAYTNTSRSSSKSVL